MGKISCYMVYVYTRKGKRMASKPEKAIDRFTAKVDHFVKAASRDELRGKLMNCYGGDSDTWKRVMPGAFREGKIIECYKDGDHGYRTQNEKERATASTSSSPVFGRNAQAVTV